MSEEQKATSTLVETDPMSQEIRAAASVLLERMAFLRQHGIQFSGLRDLYEVLGYSRQLSSRMYRERYMRGGIAKRIVDAYPKACWRGGCELVEDPDAFKKKTYTPFEKAFNEGAKRLKLWPHFRKADILAGQGAFSALLIGAPGELSSELPKGNGSMDKIVYLQAFAGGGGITGAMRSQRRSLEEGDCIVQEFDTDTASPRFGLPKTYQLRRTNWTTTDFGRPVHYTRIIHIAQGCTDDPVYGCPVLEAPWNYLDDLEKLIGGGAEAFWLRANQGLNLNLDKDVAFANGAEEALKAEVEEYKHNISRVLKTRGVDVKTLGSDVANFSTNADAIITLIAGTTGIPKRIFVGSEAGELASSQDRDNWRDQIVGRQSEECGPFWVEQLADRLIAYNYVPKPAQYEVIWPIIDTQTEDDKANLAMKWSQTKVGEKPVFTSAEIRDKFYGMEPVELTEADLPPAPEAPEEEVDDATLEERAAQAKLEEDELVTVLAEAVQSGNGAVVDALLGTRFAGGPGSGNFDHEGRPGERGGSSSDGGEKETKASKPSRWKVRTDESGQESSSDLTASHHNAVSMYVQDNAVDLNEVLRSGESLHPEEKSQVRALDKATQLDTFSEDTVLHRFTGKDFYSAKVGDTFEEKGFMSTSKAKENALKVGDMTLSRDEIELWEIKVPKGTPHLDVDKHMKTAEGGKPLLDEKEILLGRGTKLRVVSKGVLEIVR